MCLLHRASRARYILAVMDSGTTNVDHTANEGLARPFVPNPLYRGVRSIPIVKVKKEKPAYVPGPRAKEHPMHRKTKRLYTLQELADRLGCSTRTVSRLRKRFMDKRQLDYLKLAGYSACFYPIRREEREP